MASGEQGPLDGMYTNKVLVIIVSVCCGCIGLILNLIGFFTAKNPEAKANAKLGLIISVIMLVVSFALNFAMGGLAMLTGAK